MPIISEKSEESRSVPRRWLALGGVLLALLLLLPLVPFVTPVALHVSDRWLFVQAMWLSPDQTAVLDDGLGGMDFPASFLPSEVFAWRLPPGDAGYTATSDYHGCWCRLGHIFYWVQWFRGHRVAKAPDDGE